MATNSDHFPESGAGLADAVVLDFHGLHSPRDLPREVNGAVLNWFEIEQIPGRGIGSDLLRRWIRDEEKTGLAPLIDLGEKMT